MIKKSAIVFLTLLWTTSAFGGSIKADPQLLNYSKQGGVSGNISSVGSDTLNNLMTLWSEKFKQFYPNVNIQVEGKGSSTAPPALISATAQLGPMSRGMKQKEIDAFESKFGYKPIPVRVAIDALAVFVNKDNPIKGLNMKQVDALFSKSRRRGHKEVVTWGGGGGNDSFRGVVCRTDYWSLNEPSSFLGAGIDQRTSAICLDIYNSASSRSYISLPHL